MTNRPPERGYVLDKLEKGQTQNPMKWPKMDLFPLSSFSPHTSVSAGCVIERKPAIVAVTVDHLGIRCVPACPLRSCRYR